MAKEAMYWALVSPRYSVTGLQLMKVTSEKYGQVYGSTLERGSFHCNIGEVRAKFESEAKARMAITGIRKIIDEYKPLHEEAAKRVSKLWTDERTAIDMYLRAGKIAESIAS